jgi:hypothetical protein
LSAISILSILRFFSSFLYETKLTILRVSLIIEIIKKDFWLKDLSFCFFTLQHTTRTRKIIHKTCF